MAAAHTPPPSRDHLFTPRFELQIQRLVAKVIDRVQADDASGAPPRRLLISLVGIPGSGKTTLAATVTARLNEWAQSGGPRAPGRPGPHDHYGTGSGADPVDICPSTTPPDHPPPPRPGLGPLPPPPTHPIPAPFAVMVPMDGFHHTRAYLSAMPDPATAHARRGAEFTFDADGFYRLVRAVRTAPPITTSSTTSSTTAGTTTFGSCPIYAPSFDHAIKDPVPDDIPISHHARVVVFEGLYLNMDKPPWSDVAALMDERWLVQVDEAVASDRVAARHVRAGIVATHQAGLDRMAANDLPNGRELLHKMLDVDEIIWSSDKPGTDHHRPRPLQPEHV